MAKQPSPRPTNSSEANYRRSRLRHWNDVARKLEGRRTLGGYYHRRLTEVYKFLIPPHQSVLEIGCGRGDLLAALDPARGLGIDFSEEMIRAAQMRHPHLQFLQLDAHALDLNEKFDAIILSDLLNDVWDVQTVFREISRLTRPGTRIIINSYSRLWEPLLELAQMAGVADPTLYQNWLTMEDVENLLRLGDFEPIKVWQEVLWPVPTFMVNALFNRFLVKIWPLKHLGLTNFMVARPQPQTTPSVTLPSVSVIVPARNEAGNIPQIFERTPRMGAWTELIFVEGHSSDSTYEAIETQIAAHPEWSCQLLRQNGKGKGDAVRLGFERAKGDILMILDADLTMPPEDLPRFFDALYAGKGEFINGVRLVYPMEKEAMRFLNLVANKFFSLAFSWLLGQSIKDTLCGTKVLWQRDYQQIAANRAYFGNFDPFGDFDLIFGAVKLNLKIADLPIRYRERVYGTTNIQRWRHGWLLIKMLVFAAKRIKFV